MLKLPKLTIFAFLACAIAVAGAINYFQSASPSRNLKSEEMSSTAEELATQMVQIGKQVTGVPVPTLGTGPTAGACADCATALAGIANPMFQTEEFSKCDKVRQYLEADLDKLPAAFKGQRTSSPGDFPRVCMTYILRKNFEGSETQKTNALAVCKDPNGKPVHGNYPACVTEKYVNATYNYFTDVTDCLGVPQRDFMPKLSVESGLHINSINTKEYDGGLAQLTGPAISYANDPSTGYPAIKKQMLASDKASCKRLSPYLKNLTLAKSGKENRCQLISVPANPLMSVLVMSIKIVQDRAAIAKYLGPPEEGQKRFNIVARMEKLGLGPKDYDMEQLVQMMVVLGYNAGAGTAVQSLSNYLSMIEASGRKLTKADFDVGGESQIYVALNAQTRILTRVPKNTDEIWASRLAKFEGRMALLPNIRNPFKPEIVKVKVAGADGKTYDTYRVDFKQSDLSYAAYSQLYQGSGSGGYLSSVANVANSLNSVFKAGTCVPESFLSL